VALAETFLAAGLQEGSAGDRHLAIDQNWWLISAIGGR
jgi:hypothetical protein